MQSPKLKAHFKTFIRLWNKRKLPPKYYRTCSVDLDAADCTLDLDTEVIEESATPRYPRLVEPIVTPRGLMSPVFPGDIVDLSPGNALDGDSQSGITGGNVAVDSPFSTFGKTGEEVLQSPGILAKQMQVGFPSRQESVHKGSSQGTRPAFHSVHPSQWSPTKFATISRGTPTPSAFKLASSPAKRTGCPVSSPSCPPTISTFTGKFATRPLPDTPTSSRVLLPGVSHIPKASQENLSPADAEPWMMGGNIASERSPVYASVQDAIPYSTGSPKYAEIDECGIPRVIPACSDEGGRRVKQDSTVHNGGNRIGDAPRICSSQILDNDYCSLSSTTQEELTTSTAAKKSTVRAKPSLNRRRSKSMEDIYAVPLRSGSIFGRRKQAVNEEESSTEQSAVPPPVPEKNFSPQSLFQTFLGFKNRKAVSQKAGQDLSLEVSTMTASVKQAAEDACSPQKRRSQESVEASLKTSPTKKVKSGALSKSGGNDVESVSDQANAATFSTTAESQCGEPSKQAAPVKLSILTGSLRPTTRSVQRAVGHSGERKAEGASSLADDTRNPSALESSLDVLEVKQLEESPKFPRRKLKRRSSSFSVTPGKGLTFGKSSKMSTPSPRRVSFAKDVKDTESKSTPLRRSSSRRTVMISGGAAVTRQTQERLNFQSFMSSHVSPPHKGKSPSKVAPVSGKPPSPIKTSLTNLFSNLKKTTTDRDVTSSPSAASLQYSDSDASMNAMRVASLVSKSSPIKREALAGSANLFPPSPTRQVGRRVLGSPIRQPSSSNSVGQGVSFAQAPNPHHQVSESEHEKKSVRQKQTRLGSFSSPPRKPVHSLMAKLTSKTSVLCADEVRDSEGYSSNDDLIEESCGPPKPGAVFSSQNLARSNALEDEGMSSFGTGQDSKRKNGEVFNGETSCTGSMQFASNTDQLSKTPPSAFTNEPLLRFDTAFEDTDEFMPHVKLNHGFEGQLDDQPRANDVKAFARVAKIWNRTVGFDASVDPFVRKIFQQNEGNNETVSKERKISYVNTALKWRWSQRTKADHADLVNTASQTQKGRRDGKIQQIKAKADLDSESSSSVKVESFSARPDINHTQIVSDSASEMLEGKQLTHGSAVVYDVPTNVCALTPCPVDRPEIPSNVGSQSEETCTATANSSAAHVNSFTSEAGSSFCLPPYPVVESGQPEENIDQEIKQAPLSGIASSPSFPDPPALPSPEESSFILPPYPQNCEPDYLMIESDLAAIPVPSESSQIDERSLTPPTYPEVDRETQRSNGDLPLSEVSQTDEQSFTLPPYPEVEGETLATSGDSSLAVREEETQTSLTRSDRSVSKVCDDPGDPSTTGTIQFSDPPPSLTCNTPLVSDNLPETDKNLTRIESLKRASPKVVKNDSWITARRRSSRRNQNSFHSPQDLLQLQTPARQAELGDIHDGGDDIRFCSGSDPLAMAETSPDSLLVKQGIFSITDNVSSDSSSGSAIIGNPGVMPALQAHKPIVSNTPTAQKVPLIKPATLPKTARATTLAQRRLNVQNFMISKASSKPVAKRRSSLTKEQPKQKVNSKPKNDYITMNINAVKKTSIKSIAPSSAIKQTSTISAETKNLAGNDSVASSKGQSKRRSRDNGVQSETSNRPGTLSTKLSVFNREEKTPRKKSLESRRRRSKSNGVEDENQMSFSERRKFFQQLQSSKQSLLSKPLRSGASKMSDSAGQKCVRSAKVSAVTPKPVSSQRREVEPSRPLVLSPNSDLNI
ncbi:hypothetical protein PoB_004568500 [Plakobranchus ocellatus]|uniref:Uncharacterized protein n=1 Tax=Plakobranchus ocellatus TaxID=259542 RepID=A0AAV4BF16_9GAST|nr:hypothetical protein PoB_004568500 [Plakobranchus ocellatus]